MKDNQPEKSGEEGLPVIGESEEGFVVLPVGQEQFGGFIRSLLGSPQTISKTIHGAFEIDVNDLKSIYHLILQRVTQQNEAQIIQFTARIAYSDDSTVLLNSLQELLTYNEVRPVVSVAVHLEWDLLVRFKDKKVPERQKVQVSVVSAGTIGKFEEETILEYVPAILIRNREGYINFRIEHTARTWGADIEALLTNHFRSLMKRRSVVKDWIRKHHSGISIFVSIAFFMAALISSFVTTTVYSDRQTQRVAILLDSSASNVVDLDEKLDKVAAIIAEGAWAQYFFTLSVFLIVAIVLAIVLGVWTDKAADNPEPSFLLLTKKARERKEQVLARKRKKWLSFCGAVAVSIISGIVANWLFAAFFGKP